MSGSTVHGGAAKGRARQGRAARKGARPLSVQRPRFVVTVTPDSHLVLRRVGCRTIVKLSLERAYIAALIELSERGRK